MAKNPIAIGKIPCELDSNLCHQIYGSLKPSELKKVYKVLTICYVKLKFNLSSEMATNSKCKSISSRN